MEIFMSEQKPKPCPEREKELAEAWGEELDRTGESLLMGRFPSLPAKRVVDDAERRVA